MSPAESPKIRRIALRTALIYTLVAGAWILFSDWVVSWFVPDPATMSQLSIAKGWFFVLFTGALLHLGLRRQLRQIAAEADARHQATQELREQSSRLDSIIEGTQVGTWEWNIQSGEIVVNERWAKIVGWTSAEFGPLTGKRWSELVHPEDVERHQRARDRHLAGELPHFEGEVRVRHREGHWVWVLDRGRALTRSADGRPHMMFGIRMDVTARKQAELALRESEERFRQITENIHEVFWIAEGPALGLRMLYVSPAFDHIWGRPGSGLVAGDFRWQDTVHPEDLASIRTRWPRGTLEAPLQDTYRIIRPDGSVRWIHDRAFPIRDESGGVHRIVGTAADITERRGLEHQLREAQKMQAIGTLAGGIAHDFNNLLGAIMGFAELSRLQVQDRPQVKENVEDILVAGRRAIALVRQIMAFSRSSPGERSLMQLRPVVEEAIRLLRASVPATVEIECDVQRDVPLVLADPTQVHQAVMNLGTNGWHALGNQSGVLDVVVDRCEIDPDRAAADPRLRAGRFARISVRDTGSGMSAQTMERLFEPFFTTKPPGQGTGLGLAVVHGIMRDHGGFVTVESTVGAGSIFRLHFPAAEAELPAAPVEPFVVPRGQGQRVLFVDDETALVRLGVGMLQELGYVAEGAVGPGEALARFGNTPEPYALVVTDHSMPVMSGVDLARAVRASSPQVPIILITGHAEGITPSSSAELGLADLLIKPLSLATLGVAVHNALHRNPTPP